MSNGTSKTPPPGEDHLVALRAPGDELDVTIDAGEERVVLAHPDVDAGMHLRASLPDDDAARTDRFATVDLHAQPFRLGIAPVARASACLLVCHFVSLREPQPTMLSILSSV